MKAKRPPSHVERVSASLWYPHNAPGQVVIVNGHCTFHGSAREAIAFEIHIK